MSAENLVTVRRVVEEVINKGDLRVADQVVADGYTYNEPTAGMVKGRDGYKQLITIYRNAFPDLRLVIDDQVDGGDKVVTRWTATGTHRGELFGMAPTGRTVVVTGILVTRFERGKIVEEWESYDVFGMLQQLGAAQPLTKATASAAAHR